MEWAGREGGPQHAQLPAPALPSGGPGPLALIPHPPNLQPQATPLLVPHSGLSRGGVNSGGRCQTTQEASPPPPRNSGEELRGPGDLGVARAWPAGGGYASCASGLEERGPCPSPCQRACAGHPCTLGPTVRAGSRAQAGPFDIWLVVPPSRSDCAWNRTGAHPSLHSSRQWSPLSVSTKPQ